MQKEKNVGGYWVILEEILKNRILNFISQFFSIFISQTPSTREKRIY